MYSARSCFTNICIRYIFKNTYGQVLQQSVGRRTKETTTLKLFKVLACTQLNSSCRKSLKVPASLRISHTDYFNGAPASSKISMYAKAAARKPKNNLVTKRKTEKSHVINLNKYIQFTVLEIQFRSVIILKSLSKTNPVGSCVQDKTSLEQLQKLTKRLESNYYLQFFYSMQQNRIFQHS